MKFVQNLPHSRVMVALRQHLGKTKFVQWKVKGSAVPPTWEEVLKQLDAE